MTDAPLFADLLRRLLDRARAAHENANVLQGLAFADERGWAKDDDRAELAEREAEFARQRADLIAQVAALCSDHRDAWEDHVDGALALFRALATGAAVASREPLLGSLEFDRLIAKALVPAWEALRANRAADVALGWALAVGERVRAGYSLAPEA